MKLKTKLELALVHLHCDTEDKSTEYMLQLMQDECNVSLDTCLNYLKLSEEEKILLKSQALILSN